MLDDIMDAVEDCIDREAVLQKNYKDALKATSEAGDNLKKYLNEEGWNALVEFSEQLRAEGCELARGYFIEGFRLGAEIMLRLSKN